MTVLIVDDVIMMRGILKDMLIRYCDIKPEHIYEAVDGEDALRKYKLMRPLIVLLDIAMPGMNGIETVKELMKVDSSAYIVMCAASSDETDIRECISAGALDYILKPPNPDRVRNAIHNAAKRMLINLPDSNTMDISTETSSDIPKPSTLEEKVLHLEREIESLKAETALLWKVVGADMR